MKITTEIRARTKTPDAPNESLRLGRKEKISERQDSDQKEARKWFRARRRHHDPVLVLNMSIFNSGSSWNRIFNPIPQRENVWW